MYYGAGLVSSIDKYVEVEKQVSVQSKKQAPKTSETTRSPLYHPQILEDIPVSFSIFLMFILKKKVYTLQMASF